MLARLKSSFNALPKGIKFLFTGGTTTASTFALYSFLVSVEVHYFFASLISLITGIIMGYFLNKTITFSHQDNVFIRYLILWTLLFIANISIIYIVTNFTAIKEIMAGFIALVLIIPFSYILQKNIVFSNKYKE